VLLYCTLRLREFGECNCNARYGYEGLVNYCNARCGYESLVNYCNARFGYESLVNYCNARYGYKSLDGTEFSAVGLLGTNKCVHESSRSSNTFHRTKPNTLLSV
jgi:hypothetical protein